MARGIAPLRTTIKRDKERHSRELDSAHVEVLQSSDADSARDEKSVYHQLHCMRNSGAKFSFIMWPCAIAREPNTCTLTGSIEPFLAFHRTGSHVSRRGTIVARCSRAPACAPIVTCTVAICHSTWDSCLPNSSFRVRVRPQPPIGDVRNSISDQQYRKMRCVGALSPPPLFPVRTLAFNAR